MDKRMQQLAINVVNHSLTIQPGENLLIEVEGHENLLVNAIVEEVYKAKGKPFVIFTDKEILRTQLMNCTLEQINKMASIDEIRMKEMDAYLLIRADENTHELDDVPNDKIDYYWKEYYHRVHKYRWSNTKWCVLRYPSTAAAQRAKMSTKQFEDLYYSVCNLDYSRLSTSMDKLVALMKQTKEVRITGENCDLRMSIQSMPVLKDAGHQNLPDGEVYSIPKKESVNGFIKFNTPVLHQGTIFENVMFTFRNGRIIDAQANDSKKLNQILDTDDGSRFIGEIGIGLNPYITKPILDILFDEKIWGSVHLAVGTAPVQCEDANLSSIHWDIVQIQREEYGGGELWFDDLLVRKNGYFVVQDLFELNPNNFLADS